MSPIDDELRHALHGRAQTIAPSPDPLTGIERRAKQIRRSRVSAAVAGSALAVAAIAVSVPAIQSATSGANPSEVPQFATTEPTTEPTTSAYTLDPASPWAFRGTPVDEGTRATIQREYATKRQGAEVLVTPLFAHVHEPSQQSEVVFLAEVDGAYRWGVAAATESGPEFLWDEPLPSPALALAAALPGDEGVPRLLVVTAPSADQVQYRPEASAEYVPANLVTEGVFVTALEGDPAGDSYRVLDAQEEELVRDDAPDPVAQPVVEDEGVGSEVDATAYGFDPDEPWSFRGQQELTRHPDLAVEDERLFAQKHGEGWSTRPLYAAESDAGVSVLVMLHTRSGEPALVSTTWQRGDEPAEQTDQVVDEGEQLIQSLVPTSRDGSSALLVALASPAAGGIVLEQGSDNRPDGIGDPGVGLWSVERGEDGTIRLYTDGDGVEYHAEPALAP